MLGDEPVWAQQRMTEIEFATLFKKAAERFRSIVPDLVVDMVTDFGCDPDATFFGATSLTTTTGHGFMAHGIGVPQHPHRDTWYAASPSQLNWWVPLYELDSGTPLAFHPQYWDHPVKNNSEDFDYQEWYEAIESDQSFAATSPFAQPRSLDPIELTPDIRIACAAGGVVLSSVAHLSSTLPNESLQTHFSISFQTVNQDDLETGFGAANLDAAPQGTLLSSFVRCSDLSPVPGELIRRDLARRGERCFH